MWEEIMLSIGSAFSEAICINWIEKRKREKFNKKLHVLITENMNSFADSSLDCNEFYVLIQSKSFIEIIRNYFYSTKDRLDNSEYIKNIEEYICKECSSVKHIDVREFVNKILVLYDEYLHKMISESLELNATFQLLTISHREIMFRISESEENMKKYFASLENRRIQIEDNEIKAYHDVCRKEYENIRFTGISGVENKKAQDINMFYVENTFSYYATKESQNIYKREIEQIGSIQLKDFFNIGNKIVLIGAAGLGKTTTLNYLFCNYEKIYNSYSLKVKIDLKEYAKEIGESKKDLLWCISTEFSKRIKRTKMSFGEIEKTLGKLLEDGKCLIILDALDEIPMQTARDKVRNEIGNFCEIYYLNRFIISTREAGYLRNRFDDSFLHIKINDFGSQQIKKYSENWFCSYYEKKDFDDFWEKFSVEVNRARCANLIRNPIVLILALVIFDIEKNLPNRRVEFYKKCIETFLTVREDRKGAFILNEKAKNILGMDSVIPKIAYYKYSHVNDNIGYKFNYSELKESVFDAIEVEDKINWSDAVRQYVEYLVERTELIREVDEDILDFAHKTFYEYFLAVYYTKEYENDKLLDLLYEWIGDSNNDELARLIIEVIIQNNDPRKHKCIINYLFEQLQLDDNNEGWDNKNDIFRIIADLYMHNMLQPKFHIQYNKTILYHPRYVENANFFLNQRYGSVDSRIKYDSKVLADMFCEEILTNRRFGLVLDSLYYLDNEFKNTVVNKLKEEYIVRISELFAIIRSFNLSKKKKNNKDKDIEKILNYFFIDDKFNIVLEYPQVYVSVIVLSILNDIKIDFSKFLDFKFDTNNALYYYSIPQSLVYLVNIARDNKEAFLLMLILIIDCGRKRTNIFIGYVLDSENNNKKDFTLWLWKILNKNEEFEDFKRILLERDLYIQKYENLYKKLYIDYKMREKEVKDPRVKRFLQKTLK